MPNSAVYLFLQLRIFAAVFILYIYITQKHKISKDNAATFEFAIEKELLSIFNEISDYSNNLEFKETVPPKKRIRRVMDEIYETNDYNIKSKLIPYWYNIHYLVNIYKNTESNNYQNFVRNGFSYPTYRKNFPFNEYYAFMSMLNRSKI